MNPETVFFSSAAHGKDLCSFPVTVLAFGSTAFLLACREKRYFCKSRRAFRHSAACFPAYRSWVHAVGSLGKKRLDRTVPGNFRTEDGVFSDGRNSCRICGWTTARRQTSSSSI